MQPERETLGRIDEVDALRRMEGGAGILKHRIVNGEEARHQRDDIHGDGDEQGGHGQLVAFERPPDELPLRSDGGAVLPGIGGHGNIAHGALLFEPDARIDQRKQDVADQRTDQRQRADQQHESAGEIHVLRHQRLQKQRRGRRQIEQDGDNQ